MSLLSRRFESRGVLSTRRVTDSSGRRERLTLSRLLGVFQIVADDELDAAAAGRILLVVSGLTTVAFAPLLHADRHDWLVLLSVSVVMLSALAASTVVDWRRLPSRVTLVFPALVCAALVVIGVSEPGLVAPLTGLLTLCFTYIGLTQPPRTVLVALPPACVTFVFVNGGLTTVILVRVMIAAAIWTMLTELLAHLASRQRELALALHIAANTDMLTGVANRRDLQTRLSVAVEGDSLAVCDLDHFKLLNDARGHAAGDVVLADFGAMLRAVLRSGDFCARYGGEEFVLVLPSTTPSEAATVLDRLHANWRLLQPDITFSAGIATCRADRGPVDTLAAADQALYVAKADGRNTDRIEPMLIA